MQCGLIPLQLGVLGSYLGCRLRALSNTSEVESSRRHKFPGQLAVWARHRVNQVHQRTNLAFQSDKPTGGKTIYEEQSELAESLCQNRIFKATALATVP